MALHIAIGLNKKTILLNNIFNKNEFEFYGNGKVIEPPIECKCYYRSKCIDDTRCIEKIKPESVLEAVKEMMQ